jgi:glycerol uptake facilitator-like aquaporin
MDRELARRATAEFVGTAFLVAIVVGSGIEAQRLSPANVGLQLLENSIATGAGLVAAFGLISVILGVVRAGRASVAAFAVGGYIAAAYWFTSSTSFANPAVPIARTL